MDILILHGWRLNGSAYSELAKKLKSKNYRVFAPNLPGFGKEKPSQKPFSLQNYVSFVKNYIKRNSLKNITIIGHSFGGRIAIKLCENNPSYIQKIILTGVPAFPLNSAKRLIFYTLAKIGKFIFNLSLLGKLKNISQKVLYRLAGSFDYTKTEGIIRQTFVNVVREDLVSPMKKIKIPTYIIWGEKDVITPLWIAKKMAKVIANSKLIIISGKNHNVVYKYPELFLKELKIL